MHNKHNSRNNAKCSCMPAKRRGRGEGGMTCLVSCGWLWAMLWWMHSLLRSMPRRSSSHSTKYAPALAANGSTVAMVDTIDDTTDMMEPMMARTTQTAKFCCDLSPQMTPELYWSDNDHRKCVTNCSWHATRAAYVYLSAINCEDACSPEIPAAPGQQVRVSRNTRALCSCG